MKKNKNVFIVTLVVLIAGLVYALGFSSNTAYGDKKITGLTELIEFNSKAQTFNNFLFYGVILLMLLLLGCILTNSQSRKKYRTSNVVSIGVLVGGLSIFAIINLIKLPGFIKEYNVILAEFPEEIERMQRISSLSPTTTMYTFGIILSIIMLLLSAYLVTYVVIRMKKQKAYLAHRNEVLANEI